MASQLDRTIDIRHYLRVLWRRKGILILCAVAAFCATLVGLRLVPRQYESSAVLSIEERVPLSRQIEEVLGDSRLTARPYGYEEQRLAKIVGNLRSRPFLERVIRILKMNEDPKLVERARARQREHPELTVDETAIRMLVGSIQARIGVSGAGPGLFRVSVRDYSPATAQLLAKWVSELFISNSTKRELDRIRAQRNFSSEQLRIYEDQVTQSEAAVKRFKETVIGTALDDNPVNRDNMTTADVLAGRLREEEANARARRGVQARAAIEAGLPAEDRTLQDDSSVRGLYQRLADAMRSQTMQRLTSPPTDPELAVVSGEVASARTDLYRALETRARTLYADQNEQWSLMADYVFAQLDADAAGATAAELDGLIADYKRRLRNQPGNEIELNRLEKELADNRQVLESFRAQVVASDLQQAVETTDLGLRVEIVDPAQLPLEPAWPATTKILVLSLLMGPLLGVGFAFLAEMLDPTLRNIDDIRRVAPEPVLGTIPLLNSVIPVRGGLRRRWVPVVVGGVVVLTVAFLLTKDRLLPDVGRPAEAAKAVEPAEGGIGR